MSKSLLDILFTIFALGISFFLGYLFKDQYLPLHTQIIAPPPHQEISIILFEKILDDQLHIEVSGPARLVWGEKKLSRRGRGS